MEILTLKCTTLDDAWFQAISAVVQFGREFKIDHGSYAGQKRKELDYITIHIAHPGVRPLIPQIPPHYGIPNPTDMEYVEHQYLPYLMEDIKKPGEDYTYGIYINKQMRLIIERYVKMFKETGGYRSNQEHIIVGDYRDHLLMDDPPCLRSIDTRIQDNKLHFFIYFRSWDLWAGFPSNLAAIQLMKEFVASEVGVEDGEMVVSSKGLHLYDYAWPLANIRLGKKNDTG
jgi:thymidylate synthase